MGQVGDRSARAIERNESLCYMLYTQKEL